MFLDSWFMLFRYANGINVDLYIADQISDNYTLPNVPLVIQIS